MFPRTRQLAATCAAILLAGCGSTGGASVGTAPAPINVAAQGGSTVPLLAGSAGMARAGQTATVGAARDAIWAQLPAAYESLGIPISVKDDATFRLGNDQVRARRALNGVQMRSIVDCGSDLAGEKAESYDIRLTVQTTLSVGATTNVTDVTTTVTGIGRAATTGGSDVSCSTKGELERRILKYVRLQLGLNEK